MKHHLKQWALIAVTLIAPLGSLCEAKEDYTPLTPQEEARYFAQINTEIQKSEDRVTQIMKDMSTPDHVISSMDRLDLENAKAMVEVKKVLLSHFMGTPSMKSPLIREKLLTIMRKENVSMNDFFELQALVNQEAPIVNPSIIPAPSVEPKTNP